MGPEHRPSNATRGRMPRVHQLAVVVLGCLALAAPRVAAARLCSSQVRPAATLLVPFFQVDLDSPAGKTTLVAVGNARSQPTLARVTLWTDWAEPTLAFDVDLPPDAVQTLNLRDVFAGQLPTTGNPGFPGCSAPLAKPPLGPGELVRLRARHTGQPDPVDGLCHGGPASAAGVAAGFVTVDAMNSCPANTATHPGTPGYFVAGGTGLASNANALYGDFFLVDPASDSAQGNTALHLVADATQFSVGSGSFYSLDLQVATGDARSPLGTGERTRFLAGGPFAAGTDLVVFAAPAAAPVIGGTPCGTRFGEYCHGLRLRLRPEGGAPPTYKGFASPTTVSAVYSIAPTAGADIQPPSAFGVIDVENLLELACDFIPIGVVRLGVWAMPIHRAAGRYSVALDSIRLQPDCL